METIIVILLLILSVASWAWKKVNEGAEQKQGNQKPELSIKDIFVDISNHEMATSHESTGRESQVESSQAQDPGPETQDPKTASARETPQKPVRTVAGIPINPKGIRQGIIISEVLGKPKSLR